MDNDRAHYAQAVRRLLAKHGHHIQVEYLPEYSPELNPQEEVWRHMRQRVTHNHYFEQTGALIEAVDQFHREMKDNPTQVLRLISKYARLISV